MLYSYNWLKELSQTKKNPDELSKMIMLKGFELEGKEDLVERFRNIVVGEIKKIEKHPDADRLQLTKVDVGVKCGGILEIVCGAHNIKVGDKVPVALVGAIVPQKKFEIKKTKIRGIESNGMLCAEDELGLGKDHGGIFILNKKSKIGESICQTLELEDTILEFSILPNRAHDCLSHIGLSREICAMENKKFKSQSQALEKENKNISQNSKILEISIKDKHLCPRYIGAVMDSIKIKPSPRWMQNRLIASGMEPINNVVDITNYVMLEIGSPLHAFDLDNLYSSRNAIKIIIRRANKNEKLELLGDKFLNLHLDDLVIADEKKAIGLAGIKGGKYSSISNQTSRIILEGANFDRFNIRKSRQRHNLNTEAQLRFEKGLSPRLAEEATFRAIELFQKYAGARLVCWLDKKNNNLKKKQIVQLKNDQVDNLLGYSTKRKENKKILENLGFITVREKNNGLKMEVPYWRLDIESEIDLVEEIGRIVGYEKIREKPIFSQIKIARENKKRKLEWRARDILIGLGFDELVNYSFYSKKEAFSGGFKKPHYEIDQPFSEEVEILRQTLLLGLIKKVNLNSSYFDNFNVFEVGRVYLVADYPQEETRISALAFSRTDQNDRVFYNLKNKLEVFLGKITQQKVVFKKSINFDHKLFDQPNGAEIFICNKKVGEIGIVDKKILDFYKIKGAISVAEMSFEQILLLAKNKKEFNPLQKYPIVERDLSMYVDFEVESGKVIQIMEKFGGEFFQRVELFDVFFDKNKNKKSLAYRLVFFSSERTLQNEEVNGVIDRIIQELQKEKIEVRKE